MRRLATCIVSLAAFAAASCVPSRPPSRDTPLTPLEPVPIVIWSSRDLPAELHAQVAAIDGVRWVTRVTVGMVDLVGVTGASRPLPRRATGAVLPLSIAAMEPSPGAEDVATRALRAGDAVLSETAATLRGMSAGSTVTIGAGKVRRTFRIGAVVSDTESRGRELVIPLAASS